MSQGFHSLSSKPMSRERRGRRLFFLFKYDLKSEEYKYLTKIFQIQNTVALENVFGLNNLGAQRFPLNYRHPVQRDQIETTS